MTNPDGTPGAPSSPPTRPEPVVLRPRRIRVICWVSAVAIVLLFTAIATALRGPMGDGPAAFRPGDQAAMIGLGVLAALGVLAFTRLRVEADGTGVRVRNGISRYDLPWSVVRAVRFDRGSSWAVLELADDEVVALLAVQAADKEYAVGGVRALRALHRAHGAPVGPGRDPLA